MNDATQPAPTETGTPTGVKSAFKFTVHCTHVNWIGKPDPQKFGRFTYSTNDLSSWRERCERTGVRIDKVTKNF